MVVVDDRRSFGMPEVHPSRVDDPELVARLGEILQRWHRCPSTRDPSSGGPRSPRRLPWPLLVPRRWPFGGAKGNIKKVQNERYDHRPVAHERHRTS